MSIYAVGDIQGCYNALHRGLEKIRFDPAKDVLWCTGDLVNRGGQSALTIDLLYSLRKNLRVVLGNHDLYLLQAMYKKKPPAVGSDLQQVLKHQDAEKWCAWLRRQPLYHHDQERNLLMVHAGLPHIWTLDQCKAYGDEAAAAIALPDNSFFWEHLFGNKPRQLKQKHLGMARLRAIINYFTRMRFVNARGRLNLHRTEQPVKEPKRRKRPRQELPWYSFPRQSDQDIQILFGHWAALNGKLHGDAAVAAVPLDTGCVWGGKLTFYNIDNGKTVTSKQKR